VVAAVGAVRYFEHATAIVESHAAGSGTRIWAFAHGFDGAAETSFYPTRKLSALGGGGATLTGHEGLDDRAWTLREMRGSRRNSQ